MPIFTNCSGWLTGSDFNRNVFTTLKMAELAPMPSARVSTTMAVNPGFLTNWRTPYAISRRKSSSHETPSLPAPLCGEAPIAEVELRLASRLFL